MNFDSVVLKPLYRAFGTDAVLNIVGTNKTLRVIDRTEGVEVSANAIGVPTIKAVAMCLAADVEALGYRRENLIDASLTFNGNTWTIKSAAPAPGPDGKGTGELMLTLINGDL